MRVRLFSCFFIAVCLFIFSAVPGLGQPGAGQWQWVQGDSSTTTVLTEQIGFWGTRGVASAANHPGGRSRSVSMTDANGIFWLFGGNGFDAAGNNGLLNDLWSYDPATKLWTWVSGSNMINALSIYGTRGVSSGSNVPGARQGANGWVSSGGDLFLFGGQGYGTTTTLGFLNDVWRYRPSTNQWTWMSGSNVLNAGAVFGTQGMGSINNRPASRLAATSWTDGSGICWLFGGFNNNRFSDLWKYDPATNEWTWVGGSTSQNQRGNYGTRGVAGTGSGPGARLEAFGWVGAGGALFLMGGSGFDANGNVSFLNDLWSYEPGTNQWTWLSGNNLVNQAGVYGSIGTETLSNVPGARQAALTWQDASGLWLMGGTNTSGYLNDVWKWNPSTGGWTWVSGKNTINPAATYELKGVASGTALPGGRQFSAGWSVGNGMVFVLGGVGLNANTSVVNLNDFWNYNTSTNQWTWLSGSDAAIQQGKYGTRGVASVTNQPGGRRSVAGVAGTGGRYWMFGGQGFGETGSVGFLNDLWQFDAATRQWTWVSGSKAVNPGGVYGTRGVPTALTVPGARLSSGSWLDESGNFWLFGGFNNSFFNDLWRFNTQTGQWTWVSGSNNANAAAVYGTKGVRAASNVPSARRSVASWKDAAGNFWILGGSGRTINGQNGLMNDFWRYEPTLNQWTWMGGSGSINATGTYGVLGVAGTGEPGSRQEAHTWTDADGNLWLLGGDGVDDLGNPGLLNDLWKYDVVLNQWTWMGGSTLRNPLGSYGAVGVAAASNQPGGRQAGVTWTDSLGRLWLYGGVGFAASGASDYLNDLWFYDPAINQWTWAGGGNTTFPSYRYGVKNSFSTGNQPPARSTSAGWADADGNLWLLGGFGRLYGTANTGVYYNDLWRYQLPCKLQPRFILNDSSQCLAGNRFELTNRSVATARGVSYNWNFGDGTSSSDISPAHTFATPGIYTIRLRAQSGFCSDSLQRVVEVLETPAVITAPAVTTVCSGTPVLLKANRGPSLSYQWLLDGAAISGATDSLFSVSQSGSYTLHVSNTVTSCSTTSAPVTITVQPLPVAPTGSAGQSFCTGATVTDLAATGSNLKWYSGASGGTALTPGQLLVNGATYYASQTTNGCESKLRLPVTVTINTTQSPTGVGLQTFCNAATIADLAVSGTDVTWYSSQAGGDVLPSASALVNGNVYYASQRVNGCESQVRFGVSVVLNQPPAPTGSAAQTFCTSGTIASLTASGIDLRWYSVASGGTPLSPSTILNNGSTYYASQTLAGCESAQRLEVRAELVTVNPPTGNAIQTFCNQATLNDLVVTGNSVKWYAAASGGAVLQGTVQLVSNSTFYASQTLNGCESPVRLPVTAVVNSVSVPSGALVQEFCSGATLAQLVAAGTSVRWYATPTGGTALLSSVSLVNGQVYYATQTLGGCESVSRLPVTVRVSTVAAPSGSSTQLFCGAATVADLTLTGTAVRWYAGAAGGTLLPAGTVLADNMVYYASQTVAGCESAERFAVTVRVTPVPGAPTGAATQTFCSPATVQQLQVSGTVVRWYASATGGVVLPLSTLLVNGSTYYASQNLNGCESSNRLAVSVSVTLSPARPVISVNGFDLSSSAAAGNQWFLNGVAIPGATAAVYRPLQPGTYTVQVTNGACSSIVSEAVNFVSGGGEYIRLQPNPVRDQLQVIWMLRNSVQLHARLYTSQGVLLQRYSNLTSGVLLQVGHLQPGVYLLELLSTDGKKQYSYRFVKMR